MKARKRARKAGGKKQHIKHFYTGFAIGAGIAAATGVPLMMRDLGAARIPREPAAIVAEARKPIPEEVFAFEKKRRPFEITRSRPVAGCTGISARLPKHGYSAEIISSKELLGKPLAGIGEALRVTGAGLVVNGGFFESGGAPSGLFMRNGSLVSEMRKGRGDGVLYALRGSGELKLCRAGDFFRLSDYRAGRVRDSVQLTLLSEGNARYYTPRHRDKKALRTLVGLRADGTVVFSLYTAATFPQADLFMRKAHGCVEVAALDGGSSSGLAYVGKDGRFSIEQGRGLVANFVVIRQK